MWVCWHLLFSVCIDFWLVGCFLCCSDGNKNIHILFPFPLPLQPVGIQSRICFLSCLSIWKSVVWCSLSHFPLPASPGSLLFPLPEPFACSQPGQGQNLLQLLIAETPSNVVFLPLLTHRFSPIPCLPAWGPLCCLKSSYLDFLVLPTPWCVLEYIRQTLQQEGSVCNQWSLW